MKILHISTYDTGGAGIACIRLHEALLSEGIESKVLVLNKTKSTPMVFEIWEDMTVFSKLKHWIGYTTYIKKQQKKLPKQCKAVELFSFPNSYWNITNHYLYKEADIIHLHWVSGFLEYQSFFSNCTKKIIWTLHDCEPFSNGFHYPVFKKDDTYAVLEKQNELIKKEALRLAIIQIVSPSKWLSEVSEKSNLFKKYKHTVIVNCRADKFKYLSKTEARKKLNIPLDEKRILFIADTLNYERKGLSFLYEAIEHIDIPNIHFFCVGKGSPIKHNRVTSLGEIKDAIELNTIYAASDVYVIPSLQDNLPNTIQEALCSGTPVVGFKSGGIPEMVSSENGIICEEKTALSLALNIEKALTKILWNRKAISETAIQKYSSTKCAKAYKKLYNT